MIICMILATAVFVFFLFLFMTADENITGALLTACRETELEHIKKGQIALNMIVEDMKKTKDLKDKARKREAKKIKRKMEESKKLLEKYSGGKISGLDLIPAAGYRLMQLMKWDMTNPTVKRLNQKCQQFKEKKEAMNYTYYLLGALFGYIILGISAFFGTLGLTMALGLGTRSVVVAVTIFVFFALFGYIPLDNVNTVVNKRAEDIERQFPQVVSKLALLTVAGMEVSQAWKLASNGRGTLYEEMNRVLIDFDNNVSPVEAYSKFLNRCSNKYTTKLATAIIQNASKGNAEIVKLFKQLNEESWLEHKHNARRMGERIQSKLMVPTLLMFAGIIILVIVPVISGFNF